MNLLNNCDEVSSSSSKTTNNFNNLINSTTAEPPQPQPQPQGLSTSTTTTSVSTRHHSSDIVYSSHTKSTLISKAPSDFIQTQPSSPEPTSSIQTISNQITDDLPNQEVSVVTPFLVKHISDANMIPKDNFHKYCYRHNPDITCNKHTDEARMKLIQDQLDKLPNGDQQAITHVWSIFSAAPVQHRQLILQGLLSQCCFPQLSFISQEVSSLIKIDFISTLPQEISLKILCYLDCRSLCNAAQVSRKWKSLADDDRVWHYMCQQHIDRKCPNCGWGLPLMHMKRAREMTDDDNIKPIKRNDEQQQQQQQQQQQGSSQAQSQVLDGEGQPDRKKVKLDTEDNHQKVVPTSVVVRKRPWKSVYSERFKLEKNWRKGTHTIKTFTGHSDGVTCLQFNRKYLMTGSYDTTIKIWKIDSGECVKTLTGHTKGVRALVFDNQKLISGGLDSTIKVWNYHTGQCIATYRGHEDAVVSVDFTNKSIVSGSADHTVRVWHVDSRTCYTLRGHTDWVNHVKIHSASNTIFSASDDTTIRMWDMNSNECIKVFGGMENNGHIGQVQCIIPFTYKEELIEDESESDSENNQNSTTTTTTTAAAATATATAMGATLGTNNISLPNDTATINRSTFTPSNNNTATTATTPNSYPTHFLTSALDNTIKLWDVATGKCIRTQFGHIEGVWSIAADTFRIISGAHDRLIKVWDLQNGKCLHTFSNNSSVSCVGLSDSRFVAGLENGEVKMYCFD
ncbi:F-box and WD-40 domain-containing protein MET30 [Candida albicans P34048]|nr:F-box and WD-40 domain-containing protein MET30 [Candida albicans P34048]